MLLQWHVFLVFYEGEVHFESDTLRCMAPAFSPPLAFYGSCRYL